MHLLGLVVGRARLALCIFKVLLQCRLSVLRVAVHVVLGPGARATISIRPLLVLEQVVFKLIGLGLRSSNDLVHEILRILLVLFVILDVELALFAIGLRHLQTLDVEVELLLPLGVFLGEIAERNTLVWAREVAS